MGTDAALLMTAFLFTGRPEFVQILEAQYQIGPQIERYVQKNTPKELLLAASTIAPVVQVLVTRRIDFKIEF